MSYTNSDRAPDGLAANIFYWSAISAFAVGAYSTCYIMWGVVDALSESENVEATSTEETVMVESDNFIPLYESHSNSRHK